MKVYLRNLGEEYNKFYLPSQLVDLYCMWLQECTIVLKTKVQSERAKQATALFGRCLNWRTIQAFL